MARLRIELIELRYRIATAAYFIQLRLGRVTRETLLWVRPIVVSYTGLNRSETLLQSIDKTLELTDAQIATLAQSTKFQADGALGLKKYTAALLDSKFALISALDTQLQNQLLELRVHLSLFNEEVDQARYYFQLTFSSGISEQNYKRAITNLSGCYKNAADRGKMIADQIAKIML